MNEIVQFNRQGQQNSAVGANQTVAHDRKAAEGDVCRPGSLHEGEMTRQQMKNKKG